MKQCENNPQVLRFAEQSKDNSYLHDIVQVIDPVCGDACEGLLCAHPDEGDKRFHYNHLHCLKILSYSGCLIVSS